MRICRKLCNKSHDCFVVDTVSHTEYINNYELMNRLFRPARTPLKPDDMLYTDKK